MVRRETPSDEIDRINERLFRESQFKIQDRDSYDLSFNDLLSATEASLTAKQVALRNKAFREFIAQHPDVSTERIFTKAKGKDLRRDRLKTAKKVVTTKGEFKDARKVDLKGFDTARQQVTKGIIRRRTFTIPAKSKGKVVFAMRTSVTVKGKSQARLRDSRGRFVSGKAK